MRVGIATILKQPDDLIGKDILRRAAFIEQGDAGTPAACRRIQAA